MIKFADWIVLGSAVYHLVMGGACLLSRQKISYMVELLYNIKLGDKWDPIAEYAIKPLGAFAIWTGLVCAIAFWLPGPWSPWIKISLALLFLLRAAFRTIYRDFYARVVQVPWPRSRKNVIFNCVLSGLLIAGSGLWF